MLEPHDRGATPGEGIARRGLDPAGAKALDLLRTPGTEKFYIWPPGSTAPGPFGLSIRV